MTARRRREGAGGQATVELVLALPVVVVALLLVVQVAVVIRAQVLVVEAARAGARAGAVGEGTAGAVAAARRTPGLEPHRLQVAVHHPAADIEVTTSYRVPTDVPLVGPLVPDPVVTARVRMAMEEQATTT